MHDSWLPARNHALTPAFWERVWAHPRRLLLLDYDGTLAPFRCARARAALPGRTLAVLERLAQRDPASLAILSGRPVAELRELTRGLPLRLVGEHGWEEWRDGVFLQHALPPVAAEALRRGRIAAEANGLARWLECKRAAIVLHTRGLHGDRARLLAETGRALWRRVADGGALLLEPTDGGIELRARGRDKGTAVAALHRAAPPGSLAVYLGDDHGDEPAFRRVKTAGLGVRVGPGERDSHALWRLAGPAEVTAFLEQWERTLHRLPLTAGRSDGGAR